MLKRYTKAVTSGTLMTFALLFVMQLLISIQPSAAGVAPKPIKLTYAPPPRETPPPPPQQRLVRETLTNVDVVPRTPRHTEGGAVTGIYIPRGGEQPVINKLPPMQNLDGPLVSIIRIQPAYPSSAEARGLEGYTIVEFDVLANGQTTNIRILESSHAVFEKPSIKAAQRFKFKPRIIDGQALPSLGIQNLFRFQINED